MKKTLLGLTAMTLFFAACKKDDATPGTYYLSKLIQVGEDGNDTTLISWNADNTFKETYSSAMNNGQLEFFAEGPVYEGGKIVGIKERSSFNPNSHYTKSFVYTGTQVTKVHYYWDNDQDGEYIVSPRYDSLVYTSGKLAEVWGLHAEQPENVTKYILTWEGNNVKTCSLYLKNVAVVEFTLHSVNKYTYDNRPGFQYLLGDYNWLSDMNSFELLSANNLVKEEVYSDDVLRSTYTNVYTYEGNLLKAIDAEDKYIDPPSTETYKVKFEYITK
ncbi:hypothetical protein AAHN97_17665 [Chitinophaga niabensis]|uniref:hypothetical protein n=1 Tax=Chitinophaga niabensis TaxID=536979 RepID=UPI0031BA2873